jgi:AcrR family transcriptional regulator
MTVPATQDVEEKPGYKQRLREVLKVSARVFSEQGYEKAGIRRITKELGKSLSALYYYVKTKEELLYLIQLETFTSLADELALRTAGAPDPLVRLRLMIENHVSHFLNNIDELKVCAHEMESLSGKAYQEVLEVRRRYFRDTRSIVADLLRQFGNEELDPNLATLNLFGMLNWTYMWYDPKHNKSVNELADQIYRLFVYGLASGETDCRETGAGPGS